MISIDSLGIAINTLPHAEHVDFRAELNTSQEPSMKYSSLVSAGLAIGLIFSTVLVQAANLPDVQVRPYKGRPTVFINGKPNALPGYSTFGRSAWDNDLPLLRVCVCAFPVRK